MSNNYPDTIEKIGSAMKAVVLSNKDAAMAYLWDIESSYREAIELLHDAAYTLDRSECGDTTKDNIYTYLSK